MFVVRGFRLHIGRVVAVLLLLWTAADIVNAQMCASDQQRLPFAAVLHVDDSSAPGQIPYSVDDCFCCSHTVQIATVQVSTPALLPRERTAEPKPVFHSILDRHVDHPPQASPRV